jgi:hypothetical protein
MALCPYLATWDVKMITLYILSDSLGKKNSLYFKGKSKEYSNEIV